MRRRPLPFLLLVAAPVAGAAPPAADALVARAVSELDARPAAALRDADRALDLDRSVRGGQRVRGEALEALHRSGEAAAAFRSAVAAQAEDEEAIIDLARNEAAADDTDGALALLKPLVTSAKSGRKARFERAMILTRFGRTDDARADYDAIIAAKPSAAALYNRGWLHADAGAKERAIADFEQARLLDPGDVDTLTSLGTAYLKVDRPQAALDMFAAALARNPRSTAALGGLADSFFNLHDWPHAAAAYRAAERASRNYADLVVGEAQALHAGGNDAAAIAAYGRALRIDPKSIDALSGRAALLRSSGHGEAGVVDLTRAIAVAPARADLLVSRAWALRALGRGTQARADADAACKLDAKSTGALNVLGLLLADASAYGQAIDAYDRGLAIDPRQDAILYNRADAYVASKRYDRAIRDYDAYLRLVPDDPDAYQARGKAYWLIDDDVRAVEEFDAALHLDPKHASAYWYRSKANAEMGEKDAAQADRARALQLDPTLTD